ncbi:MAG TPA: hypothetical protein VLV50_02710 [Stellaceae bacterium]|nr:hypothetical protein [Stellaceae bacterium]
MSFRSAILALVLCLLGAAPQSHAALLGDAAVPYRAERTVTVDGRTYSGAVESTPGHQRHEQDLLGMHDVFLLDTAAAKGFLVLPSVKTYVEFPFPPLMAELDSEDLLSDPVGQEKVAGVSATKYRVDHRAADGSHAKGFLWLARGGILVRLQVMIMRAHDGRPMQIEMELSHLVTGPVDPALFILPQGFARLPAGALGPLLGGKPPS